MACNTWQAKIDAYVDAELPQEEMRALDTHVRSCPSCAADALARVQWKRAIKAASVKRYAPSAEFRQRIQQQIAPRRKPALWGFWLPRLAAAAVVLIVAALGADRWFASQQSRTFAELADLHVTTLASASPVDVVSTDRHTVKPWFAGKIPFTFNLPEFANTPFTLLGGRVAYADGMPGAQLLFQIRQHRISVFIFEDRGGLGRSLGFGDTLKKHLSFNVETWSEAGLRYFVISDVSPGDIRQLSQLLKSAAKS